MNNKSISNMALENLRSMQDMSVTSSLLGKILVLTELKLHIQDRINVLQKKVDDQDPLK
jgi:hypothetical protein